MKYVSNKQNAITYISYLPLDDELKEHLKEVVGKHAIDDSTVEVSVDDENVTLWFEADHDLDVSFVLNDYIVVSATVDRKITVFAIKKTSIQGNIMNTTVANESTSTNTDAPAFTEEEREALLAKIAAYEKAAGAKGEKPTSPAKPSAAEDAVLAAKIGKGVLYTVGAVAVVAGGFLAWKKWGSGSSAS